ncbi:hypothetical protein NB311A_14375 [Nitrobacter sp. Nb-311A]|uniref:hypothetical protein n=1 Tax=unclassified Nitrobacter TaxID=2620411 RepID=UPI00006870C3|nr:MULTISPECIES: hypothetical protein [unclassified Nitrobacter]EAQ35089.1 hypothetical protein NB311A_14375 [Nitrobacter sp. Nb-311A]
MTRRTGQQAVRRLLCSGCGTEFSCDPSGNCWCAEETARLPMPPEGSDCLCRDCLRKAAARSSSREADPVSTDP